MDHSAICLVTDLHFRFNAFNFENDSFIIDSLKAFPKFSIVFFFLLLVLPHVQTKLVKADLFGRSVSRAFVEIRGTPPRWLVRLIGHFVCQSVGSLFIALLFLLENGGPCVSDWRRRPCLYLR